jgi:hypothetical protein
MGWYSRTLSSGAALFVLAFPAMAQSGPPCGHYRTPACQSGPASVNIPANMSAEDCFQRESQAYAQRQYSVSAAYMERAAALGNTRAQAALGLDYVNGTGEPKDLHKAVHWLTLAADKGHRVAQAQLGDLYEEGDGVPVDSDQGIPLSQARRRAALVASRTPVGTGICTGLRYAAKPDPGPSMAGSSYAGRPRRTIAATGSHAATVRHSCPIQRHGPVGGPFRSTGGTGLPELFAENARRKELPRALLLVRAVYVLL